ANRRRNAVGAENQDGTMRHLLDGFYKECPAPACLLHYVSVMDDLLMDIDRRTVRFLRELDDIHGAHYARAEAPRPYPQQYFSICCSRHFCPKSLISEDSIIPHGAPRPHPVSQEFPFT